MPSFRLNSVSGVKYTSRWRSSPRIYDYVTSCNRVCGREHATIDDMSHILR